jgi:DNA-binding CsgD family transcriptional regulator
MSISDTISAAINSLYIAAADPAAWPDALATISTLFGGAKVSINHQNFVASDLSWALSHNYDLEAIRLHYEVFNTPEKNLGLRALLMATPMHPFTISSFITPNQYYRDPAINIVLVAQDIHHGLLNVVDKKNVNTSLLIYRGRKQGDFDARETEISRLLGAHVRNAVRIAHASLLTRLSEDSHAQIDSSRRYGAALLSPRGHLVHLDAYAERVLEASKIERGTDGNLSLGASNGGDFLAFLNRASAFADYCVRVDGDKILHIKMLPDPYVTTCFFLPIPLKGVALRLIEPGSGRIRLARHLFRLTEAESAIAELLCHGSSLGEIAERLQITNNTLKTHLKSIYAKTNTGRQGALIAKLLEFSE